MLGDGLSLFDLVIPRERFRPILKERAQGQAQEAGGEKLYGRIPLFKMMILQQLHNLGDEQTEYQIWDRLSFQRFLGISLEEAVPAHTTLWLFRKFLAQAQLTEQLFTTFHGFLRETSYAARAGQIIDASFVTVPMHQMHRKEQEQVTPPRTGRINLSRFTTKIPALKSLRKLPIVPIYRSCWPRRKITTTGHSAKHRIWPTPGNPIIEAGRSVFL
ncbi:MAG: transposase [Acidithiobacillaceae bacterium]|nr:transposase [Acidithiobacillaceae bacterium]